tara:strand:+ start:533 stop:1762 length:1230 start_codon:yes stop_codon:yes gene_type:complete
MTLFSELKERGFIHQCTNEEELSHLIENKKIKFYIGFDCTAKSLHVGSLIQIMIMKLFQKYGHVPIILIGKGTTKIGDPSGKDETRKMLTDDEINANGKNLEKVFSKFLNMSENKTLIRDNAKWLQKLNYVDFLRDYGKHFTINKMLSFDSVKIRLEREQSLSFVEFNYMIFQAYDFYELNKTDDCALQIGGSDQWGNIVNGVELIRRVNNNNAYGLTTPLLTNANGDKMGKTADGAVWLDEDMLSPYDYWQFWRNVDDRDVIKFIKLFTVMDLKKINELEKNNKNINELKVLLANEATKLLHGETESQKAEKIATELFSSDTMSDDMPTLRLKADEVKQNQYLSDLIVRMEMASSKSESRKLIRGNGVKVNRKSISDEMYVISQSDLENEDGILVSVGKKRHFKITLD